jgi:succinate dehydrogenase cytochrome b556 subunit
MIAWVLQRISGAALLFIVAIHIWSLHYAHPDKPPDYGTEVARLKTIGYIVFDISLLVLALYHGLNGVRNIVLDYTRNQAAIRRWAIGLSAVGVIFSVFGALAVIKIFTMG